MGRSDHALVEGVVLVRLRPIDQQIFVLGAFGSSDNFIARHNGVVIARRVSVAYRQLADIDIVFLAEPVDRHIAFLVPGVLIGKGRFADLLILRIFQLAIFEDVMLGEDAHLDGHTGRGVPPVLPCFADADKRPARAGLVPDFRHIRKMRLRVFGHVLVLLEIPHRAFNDHVIVLRAVGIVFRQAREVHHPWLGFLAEERSAAILRGDFPLFGFRPVDHEFPEYLVVAQQRYRNGLGLVAKVARVLRELLRVLVPPPLLHLGCRLIDVAVHQDAALFVVFALEVERNISTLSIDDGGEDEEVARHELEPGIGVGILDEIAHGVASLGYRDLVPAIDPLFAVLVIARNVRAHLLRHVLGRPSCHRF